MRKTIEVLLVVGGPLMIVCGSLGGLHVFPMPSVAGNILILAGIIMTIAGAVLVSGAPAASKANAHDEAKKDATAAPAPKTPKQPQTAEQKVKRIRVLGGVAALLVAGFLGWWDWNILHSHLPNWIRTGLAGVIVIPMLVLVGVAINLLFMKPKAAQAQQGNKANAQAGAGAEPTQGGQQGTQAGIGGPQPDQAVGAGGETPPPPPGGEGPTRVQRFGPFAIMLAAVEAVVIVLLATGVVGVRQSHPKPASVVDPCQADVRAQCEKRAVATVAATLTRDQGYALCESPPGDERLIPCSACKAPLGSGSEDCALPAAVGKRKARR